MTADHTPNQAMSSQQTHAVAEAPQTEPPLLEVDSVSVEFTVPHGRIRALRDVSLTLERGQTLGIAGESGSGKSTLALAIVQYLDSNGAVTEGEINLHGTNLVDLSRSELKSVRGNKIAHVAQNPTTALNPSLTIGEQIKESIDLHQDPANDSEAMDRVYEMLEQVNVPDPVEAAKRYPSELSGGQQQRALIAVGLACNPELLILDEPTTGLDVTTQSKLLSLIDELRDELEIGILIISHNLGVLAQICDRISILYAGEVMENGPVREVFENPSNPYTQSLLATTPEAGANKKLRPIPGQIPDLAAVPSGCIFADRCDFATEECRKESVDMEHVDGTHETRCWRWETVQDNPIDTETKARDLNTGGDSLLRAEDVRTYYDQGTYFQNLLGNHQPVRAVDGVDLEVREGETVGLVGESGCGKSTLGETLLQLQDITAGSVQFRGEALTSMDASARQAFRSECQIIFQDPEASLNPRKTINEIVARPLKLFTNLDAAERSSRIRELLQQVNLSTDIDTKYPHELSGGQQQRVALARAFAANPSLIILDEPVSSLDVSVQASILNLLEELQADYGTSYLLISHDLGVINNICDRVSIMYLGEIVESGSVNDVFEPPHHPYTRALLSSIPSLNPDKQKNQLHLEGDVPSARNPPSGCSFHTRCPQKIGDICESDAPDLERVEGASESHCISCHLDSAEMSKDTEEL